MFPRLWERAVALFERLLLSAFAEAERRTDAALAQRFEVAGQSPGTSLPPIVHAPPLAAPQPVVLSEPVPAAQLEPAPVAPAPQLSQHTAPPPLQAPANTQLPRRPRGRPRKEPPQQ